MRAHTGLGLLLALSVLATPLAAGARAVGGWDVVVSGETLRIHYGAGGDWPQYGVLHLRDAYLRLVPTPDAGWGTSVLLMPSFWSGGLHQGTPVTCDSRVEGPELVLTVTGLEVCAGGSVQTTCEVRLGPPGGGALACAVSAVTAGVVPLDARPGEAFKPVMLSSMHIADEQWDAQTAYIGCRRVPLPASGWIASTSERTTTFGLLGGTSAWKVRAPSVRVSLAQPLVVTGWVTATQDPNDDNVGLWAAADQVLGAWMYRVVVGRSTELGCGYLPLSRGAIAGS